jgi:hypothetical protein
MATQAERRQWREAVEHALRAHQQVERYERRQWEIRRGGAEGRPGPGPQQFDESGFPIPQPSPGFMQRVGRLIYGG